MFSGFCWSLKCIRHDFESVLKTFQVTEKELNTLSNALALLRFEVGWQKETLERKQLQLFLSFCFLGIVDTDQRPYLKCGQNIHLQAAELTYRTGRMREAIHVIES